MRKSVSPIRQGNCKSPVWSKTERSFSNKEGEGNEDVKRGMGLDISNSIFADAARFFFLFSSDILFAVSARAPYFVKVPNFTFFGGREQTKTIFFSFTWTSIQSFKIEIQKNLPKRIEGSRWNKRDKVSNSANFLSRRRSVRWVLLFCRPVFLFWSYVHTGHPTTISS